MRDRIGQEIRVGDVVLFGCAGARFQENVVVRILDDEIAQIAFKGPRPHATHDYDNGMRSHQLIVDPTQRERS